MKTEFEAYPFEKLNQLLSDVVPNEDYELRSLTIGEPQFETPSFILDALKAHAHLFNKYPKTAGEDFLRQGMLTYLEKRFGLRLNTEQIIPTFGTREVLFNFPQFLLEGIKEPVMAFPNPFYQIYEGAARVSRARVVYLNLTAENDFQPDIDPADLSECDLVILNSPDNPTASVLTLEQMIQWVRWALEYDFVLLNDECYADLYLDEPKVVSAPWTGGDVREVVLHSQLATDEGTGASAPDTLLGSFSQLAGFGPVVGNPKWARIRGTATGPVTARTSRRPPQR